MSSASVQNSNSADMREIYLDNSATTALSRAAKQAMLAAMENYGNPSSLHERGQRAAALLRASRESIGEALGERHLADGQLIFTASGSEANALATLGVAHAKAKRGTPVILTTDSEHPSVARNLDLLEAEGYRVVRVPTVGGALDMKTVYANCTPDLFLVSMMLVNNETGARYPLREVFAAAHAANPNCVCHADAVQGFLKVPMTVKALGADLITVSSHKIHGPKGVGALYVSPALLRSKRIAPVFMGGGQEFGLRSGTENTVGIAGFAAAAREGAAALSASLAQMEMLSARLLDGLSGGEIRANLPTVRAPHIVSLTLPRIKSETMLHYLSARGIYVSSGSACSSHAPHPSEALLGFGLPVEEVDTTLRISLSAQNTAEEIDALLATLQEGVATLIRIRR